MADSDTQRPILIKKKKNGHGHGHHGGAWKVAYADFVTAMMAFFLLLWLISSTSEEQKEGIADYFSPNMISTESSSGSDGVLGGETITADGAATDTRSPIGFGMGLPSRETEIVDGAASDQDRPQETQPTSDVSQQAALNESSLEMAKEELRRRQAEQEAKAFQAAEDRLQQSIEGNPDLAELKENLLVEQTKEGLRIQLIDQQGTDMFPSGSAEPHDHTRRLLAMVSQAIRDMPNNISISGHTDSTPYRNGGGYTNWELSSDRANASRRALIDSGLDVNRVETVMGKADREPLDREDTTAPRNRRISIVLLRQDSEALKTPLPESANTTTSDTQASSGQDESISSEPAASPPSDTETPNVQRSEPLSAPSLLAN